MYNFFKSLFGLPPHDHPGYGINDEIPQDGWNGAGNHSANEGNDDDDSDNLRFPSDAVLNRSFGFPIFNDSIEIHKFLEGFIGEMHKKFENFGIHGHPSISWDESDQGFASPFSEKPYVKESLRDSYLKSPGFIPDRGNSKKEDVDLDGQVKVDDVENFIQKGPQSSNNPNSMVQFCPAKSYSKSVFIRTIRRPDGSVETIKKIRDHTGKEETIVTQTNPNDPYQPPVNDLLGPNDDTQGISIFKKLFGI